jgi:hypothetical protein
MLHCSWLPPRVAFLLSVSPAQSVPSMCPTDSKGSCPKTETFPALRLQPTCFAAHGDRLVHGLKCGSHEDKSRAVALDDDNHFRCLLQLPKKNL